MYKSRLFKLYWTTKRAGEPVLSGNLTLCNTALLRLDGSKILTQKAPRRRYIEINNIENYPRAVGFKLFKVKTLTLNVGMKAGCHTL